MQAFVAEAQAMLRAHVLAIGGNAMVSYQLNEIVLFDNPHKHQVSKDYKSPVSWRLPRWLEGWGWGCLSYLLSLSQPPPPPLSFLL